MEVYQAIADATRPCDETCNWPSWTLFLIFPGRDVSMRDDDIIYRATVRATQDAPDYALVVAAPTVTRANEESP